MVTVKLRVYKFYKEQHAKVNIRDADREESFIHSFLYSVCIFCCCFCVTDLLSLLHQSERINFTLRMRNDCFHALMCCFSLPFFLTISSDSCLCPIKIPVSAPLWKRSFSIWRADGRHTGLGKDNLADIFCFWSR